MLEIRIHGRGGQGNVAAAYMLATAAFEVGKFVQAFPNFGAERRGAPVVAFVRIADQAFYRRCQVEQPSFLIIQDDALLNVPGVTDGLQEGGSILVNSTRPSEELSAHAKCELIALPATALAKEILGRPVPNTALLAAFVTMTGLMPVDALVQAVTRRFRGDVAERNTRLIKEAASLVTADHWKDRCHVAAA